MTDRQTYLDEAIHAAWHEGNDALRRQLQEELEQLIKQESKFVKEPIDDIDPDREEQIVARRRERLQRTTCHCGKPKQSGMWQCPDCAEWDYRGMVRLNPPSEE
jgi:lipopolysaccharide biosynthesis regulator YciM